QQGGQQGAGQQQAGGQQQGGGGLGTGGGNQTMQQLQAEQGALKQGLEQLGRNLADAGEKSTLLNRDVGSALGRANLSMEQTLKGLEQSSATGRLPTQEAEQTVDALNRLALALANNEQQIDQSQSGTGTQQALEQLTELAQQQGSLNGRTNSLLPMNLAPKAMADQMQ